MTCATTLIHQRLTATLDLQQHSADVLAEQLTQLAACLFHSFLNDGKILIYAPPASQCFAQYWVNLLTQGCGRERMGLPALALGDINGIAREKAVYTHGRPQDVLLILAPPEGSDWGAVLQAAAEQGMRRIFIGSQMPTVPADLSFILPHDSPQSFNEHLPALCHSVCAALDAALLDGLVL